MSKLLRALARGVGVLALSAQVSAPVARAQSQARPSESVNTLRGTASTSAYSRGNTIPAATRPFGFNFWTPMTDAAVNNWIYRFDQTAIQGFAVSHMPSPWLGDYAQLQIMPMLNELQVEASARADKFSHKAEVARPYYYKVDLEGSGIRTELTPSDHGAILRFTFPKAQQSFLLFDTVDSASGELHVDRKERTITGYVDQRTPRMYFHATLDKPIENVVDPSGGGLNTALVLSTQADEVVTLRLATSYISANQARSNFQRELVSMSFDQLLAAAQQAWDAWLGRIDLEGATPAERTTFYSSLYRVGMYPNAFWEDVDGSPKYFSPFSRKLRSGKLYVNNGFWDTYRAAWPLYTLLSPSMTGTMLEGFVQVFKDVGWVPRWSGPGALDVMVGSHSDAIFADAYLKGVVDFDAQAAYESMLKNALVFSARGEYGRKGNARSIFRGYVPLEDASESAAWHLEDTTNDFLISRMAESLGDSDHARYFRSRSLEYANLFSSSVGFLRGRHADGTFRTSDKKFKPNEWGYEFTEGCAWHYIAAATHDPRGLANLYGGPSALASKLDAVFQASPEYLPGSYKDVIHEMREAFDTGMGQYAHANEPVHSTIYMYDYAGEPAKTQKHVRDALSRLYGPGDADGTGYLGDEDNGQMSAWYVFGALGFYPAAAGQLQYAIGSPLFTKATIHLENGSDFVVAAYENSPANRYIQRARLNGRPLDRPYLEHAEVAAGGELELEMGPTPSKWASDLAALPRSVTSADALPAPAIDCAQAGAASASSENREAGEVADRAFDDNSATKWLTREDHGYVQYQLADHAQRAVEMYTLTSADDEPQRDPSTWTLTGSDNGSSWTVLDTRTDESFEWRRQTRVFAIAHPTTHRYYRLTIERNHGAPLTQLAELELLTGLPKQPVALTAASADVSTHAATPQAYPAAGGCSADLTGQGCELGRSGSHAWEPWIALAWLWIRRRRPGS